MSPVARILVIDAGTTGIRALIYDESATILAHAYTEFPQYHPGPDRVEQDGVEIWDATRAMIAQALANAELAADDLTAVGITNQRATTVLWDRETGLPVTRAIVWQDTRTAGRAAELAAEWGEKVYGRTGWSLAPVYSSLSIEWMLRNVDGLQELADAGRLAFGTIDSWLIYQLTGGAEHVISASNASVTGSYDLTTDQWYTDWLNALGIPVSLYPEVRDDSGLLGHTTFEAIGARVPITSAIADQHSALFAQGCIRPGMVKCTHGTGTFLDMTIGATPVIDTSSGLTSQIAWRIGGETVYALEGYAGSTGAAVQWLRDGAQIIASSAESEEVARSVPDNGGVRATLEGIVFSVRDFIDVMSSVSGYPITQIAVDGGASRNDLLVQFQADQLDATVSRPKNTEATSLGAALLAGLATGVWESPADAVATVEIEATFTPQLGAAERDRQYATWRRAVDRARGWLDA